VIRSEFLSITFFFVDPKEQLVPVIMFQAPEHR
jgi:hypothetical protein